MRVSCRHWSVKIGAVFFIQERRTKMEKIRIEVDKVILYYMDRVDPDGNLYRFYVYKDMASEIEYFCTEEAGNMTIPIGEGKYIEIVPKEIEKIPVRGYFRGSEKEGQVFCDMITERIEKYEKRMSYDKGKLNN